MTIGLSQFRDLKHLSVHWTLFNPVLSAALSYSPEIGQ
jgi:hypothetical protein